MNADVAVVDYGLGNLFSVQKALEHCGASVAITDDPGVIAQAPRIVLPGVGAFKDGMSGLRERNLVEPLLTFARSGRPLLGICLGMQMLLSRSEEFGDHAGLGIIAGRVIAIPRTTIDGRTHRIPHIGWSELYACEGGQTWQNTMLESIVPGTAVYLVHSYTAWPDDPSQRLADCRYGGHLISAAIRAGNVYGSQFHPEKSGPAGLEVLRKFLSLNSN